MDKKGIDDFLESFLENDLGDLDEDSEELSTKDNEPVPESRYYYNISH